MYDKLYSVMSERDKKTVTAKDKVWNMHRIRYFLDTERAKVAPFFNHEEVTKRPVAPFLTTKIVVKTRQKRSKKRESAPK